jgi:predicted SnoaL-like aldol condensation-catalyzing enzyme
MISLKTCALALGLGLAGAAIVSPALAESSNKDFVVNAVTELFINRDVTAVDRYWAEDYQQRNPLFPSGSAVIREAFANLPPGFKYEIGMVIAEDDMVAIHGRYTGIAPTPLIVVDIFRVEDGKIAEHWDVLQAEVLETASGLPMFEPMQ